MTDVQPLYFILAIVLGVLEVFFGYHIFRFLVMVAGVLVGFLYGPIIYALLTSNFASSQLTLLFALIGAVVFGLLAWFLFSLAVFLWGLAVGYTLGLAAFGDHFLAALVTALVLALLAVVFQRFLIVVLMALNGAWLVVASAAFLLGYVAAPPGLYLFNQPLPLVASSRALLLVLTLVLAAIGTAYQFRRLGPEGYRRRAYR